MQAWGSEVRFDWQWRRIWDDNFNNFVSPMVFCINTKCYNGCGVMTWLKDEQEHLTCFEYYGKLTRAHTRLGSIVGVCHVKV